MRSDFSLNKVTTEFSLVKERRFSQYTMIGVTVGKGKSRSLQLPLLFFVPIQRIVLQLKKLR